MVNNLSPRGELFNPRKHAIHVLSHYLRLHPNGANRAEEIRRTDFEVFLCSHEIINFNMSSRFAQIVNFVMSNITYSTRAERERNFGMLYQFVKWSRDFRLKELV
jgi:hypothetical protein